MIDADLLAQQAKDAVNGFVLKLQRDRRIVDALQQDNVRTRTDMEAAYRALGRLIGDGTFV